MHISYGDKARHSDNVFYVRMICTDIKAGISAPAMTYNRNTAFLKIRIALYSRDTSIKVTERLRKSPR